MSFEPHQYKQLARLVLEHPREFEWSLQGFGMLRFYVTKETRVHLWDASLRVPGVTDVHTHPWNFNSTVLWGVVRQHRYDERVVPVRSCRTAAGWHFVGGKWFTRYEMRAGADAHLRDEGTQVYLMPGPLETYRPGESYRQEHHEVHRSEPEDGTVTLVQRELVDEDPDRAYTYVPPGESWVDAAPRRATVAEIEAACWRSLRRWG